MVLGLLSKKKDDDQLFKVEKKTFTEILHEAYHGQPVNVVRDSFWDQPAILDYDPMKMSTYRVFCVSGSSFRHPVLIMEQIITTMVFFLVAMPVVYWADFKVGRKQTIAMWLEEQEDNMRSFAVIMTGVTTFLLSFYMSMGVSRWWTIIVDGIGNMEESLMELHLYTYQLVTKDATLTSAIRRYARSSLFLIVLWRRGKMAEMKELFAKKGDLLTPAECDKLLKVNHNLHETIWAWITDIVTMLYEEGKIESDCLLQLLLERCTKGRGAVQLIHTYIANKVPMHYVHILGFLVKLHNGILALLMGALFGVSIRNHNWIMGIMLFCRTLLLPSLFNSILLLVSELSDPFDGGMQDLPTSFLDDHWERSAVAYTRCTEHAPAWILERRAKNHAELSGRHADKLGESPRSDAQSAVTLDSPRLFTERSMGGLGSSGDEDQPRRSMTTPA